MATSKPLDEQIIDVLTTPGTAIDAAKVRSLAEEALAAMLAEADAADLASLSPLANRAQAGELRSRATDLRFEADRLEASVSALSTRVAELRDAEERTRRKEDVDAATVERDALAGEIARVYPRIVGELTSLAKRIAESDRRCSALGIRHSAEAIGRDVPPNFYKHGAPILRIGDLRIPMPSEDRAAWEFGGGGMVCPGLALLPAAD